MKPSGVAVDTSGNVYVADTGHHVIRKIAPPGVMTTLAGKIGNPGNVDGPGTQAQFKNPLSVAINDHGDVYVADTGNGSLRQILPDGHVITRLTPSSPPSAVAIDHSGNIYFGASTLTSFPNIILKLQTDGTLLPVEFGGAIRSPYLEQLFPILGLAVDGSGGIYACGWTNAGIVKILTSGFAVPFAGKPGPIGSAQDGRGIYAQVNRCSGLAIDSTGIVYFTDAGNNLIRKISTNGLVTTLAGHAGVTTNSLGSSHDPYFNNPSGIAVDSRGNLYVADTGNNLIRVIAPDGTTTTLSAAEPPLPGGGFLNPIASTVGRNGNLIVADASSIRQVTPDGTTTTIANNSAEPGEVDGAANTAQFRFPAGIAEDANGNLFIADTYNNAIRKLSSAGEVSTIAVNQQLTGLSGIAVGEDGAVYFSEPLLNIIERILPNGTISVVAGVPGMAGSDNGIGSASLFNLPSGLAIDRQNNLYVVDAGNHTVRQIAPDGTVSTVAGTPEVAGYSDGPASTALFHSPRGIAADSDGNLFVADEGNRAIRMISIDGNVFTLAGGPYRASWVDGIGQGVRFGLPTSVSVGQDGTLYVTDATNYLIRKGTPHFAPAVISISVDPTNATSGPAHAVVSASGEGLLNFQWLSDDQPVAGATNSDLAIPDGAPLAKYSVVIRNRFGSATNALTTPPPAVNRLPIIVEQPVSQTAPSGAIATFSVGIATVSDIVNFQWMQNGQPIFGNESTIAITAIPGLAGNYQVVVSNAYGSVTSSIATLTVVQAPPQVLTAPASESAVLGSQAGFRVTADGSLPLRYQWLRDGNPIAGATASSYTITNVAASDYASYAVVITNSLGRTTSAPPALLKPRGAGRDLAFRQIQGLILPLETDRSFGPPPARLGADRQGNFYASDPALNVIYKIHPNASYSILAGQSGARGFADGVGTNATFFEPDALAADRASNLYVGDSGNFTIRRISPDGAVQTVAGLAGEAGDQIGAGSRAELGPIDCLAIDSAGNIYAPDFLSIRTITPDGRVAPFLEWPAFPAALASDNIGNLYVGDGNLGISKVGPGGVVNGLAPASVVGTPLSLGVDQEGSVYFNGRNGLIQELSPNGDAVPFASQPPFIPVQFAVSSTGAFCGYDYLGNIYMSNAQFPPLLTVALSGVGPVLSWPDTDEPVVLETSPSLSAAAAWTSITNGVVSKDSVFEYPLNPSSAQIGFFRLRFP